MFAQALRPRPDTAPIVLNASGPSGQFGVLAARFDPGTGLYVWEGLASWGPRSLGYGSGTFQASRWRSARSDLAARIEEVGERPGRLPDTVGRFLEALACLDGEAAECRDRFVSACGPCTLPVALAGGDLSVLARLDGIYGPGRVEAVLGRMPSLLPILGLRAGAGPGDAAVVSACDAIMGPEPLTLPELAARVADAYLSETAGAFHVEAGPGSRQAGRSARWLAGIRRLLSAMDGQASAPGMFLYVLERCDQVPGDWMPRDAASVEAMATCLHAASALSALSDGEIEVGTLLSHAKGDWVRLARSLADDGRWAKGGGEAWIGRLGHMANAYAGEVVLPALAHARARTGEGLRADDALRAGAFATRTLFGGKGLAAVADASRDWHARGPGMTRAISELAASRGGRYPRPFPDFVASNGLHVLPILSERDLVAEGAAMRHCVGSQGAGCRRGEYAFASVRRADGTRLSTVEVVGGTRVVEHRGPDNADPPPEASKAVRELIDRNRGLRLRPPRPERFGLRGLRERLVSTVLDRAVPAWALDHPYPPTDPVRILRAASLWDRYVPRQLRGSVPAIVEGVDPGLARALAAAGGPGIAVSPWRVAAATARAVLSGMFAPIRRQGFMGVAFMLLTLIAFAWLMFLLFAMVMMTLDTRARIANESQMLRFVGEVGLADGPDVGICDVEEYRRRPHESWDAPLARRYEAPGSSDP